MLERAFPPALRAWRFVLVAFLPCRGRDAIVLSFMILFPRFCGRRRGRDVSFFAIDRRLGGEGAGDVRACCFVAVLVAVSVDMSMIWNRDDSVSLTVTWSRASMTTMTKRMMMMNEVRWSMRHKISAIGGGDSAECTHAIPVWYRNTHARQLCSAVVPVILCQFREGHVRGN